jgi:hypothetical protein
MCENEQRRVLNTIFNNTTNESSSLVVQELHFDTVRPISEPRTSWGRHWYGTK